MQAGVVKCVTCGAAADGLDYVAVYAGESGRKDSSVVKRPKCRAHTVGKGGLLPFPWDPPPPERPAPALLTESFLDDVMAQYQACLDNELGTDMLASFVPIMAAELRRYIKAGAPRDAAAP